MAALSEDAIFDVARQISSQAARDAYLDQACNGNEELRARLEELLAAHEAADSRLDSPLLEPTAAHADPLPLEEAGHADRPLQAAAADRRRRHGRRLHGRADRTRSSDEWR